MNGNVDITAAARSSLGTAVMKVCYEQVTQMRMMWAVTPQQMQQEILDRMQANIQAIVDLKVGEILGLGWPSVEVMLQSLTAKDGIKVTAIVGDQKSIHQLIDMVGKKVVLVLADPSDYALVQAPKAQDDQKHLDFGGAA